MWNILHFNVSNPFQMVQQQRRSEKEPVAAARQLLAGPRASTLRVNTTTMTRPLPFNYSEEGCLDKITKPAAAFLFVCFSVNILGVFLATLACTLLLYYVLF